jgi:hypothetical protein
MGGGLFVLRASLALLAAVALVPRAAWAQGEPLGPEFRVNTYTSFIQWFSSIASSSSGDFVVVWQSFMQDGSLSGIFGQRYASSGVPLGAEFRVNTYVPDEQRSPAVASDGPGNFVVVWSSGSLGGYAGVFGQRYSSSGAPLGGGFRVNSAPLGLDAYPAVASDPTGNFTVVWIGNTNVFGQRYASSGSALGPEFRVNTTTAPGDSQMHPSICVDAQGNFVVVWESPAPGYGWHIRGQRYSNSGVPLGAEFRANTAKIDAYFPQGSAVAAAPLGEFNVVWAAYAGFPDPSGFNISGQRFAASGVPLGSEFGVNSYTPGPQNRPSIAADGLGNFVVAWTSYGSSYGIFGQRYASSGTPLGPAFRVNTSVGAFATRPRVAAAPNAASFVVVWESYGDGAQRGIFGQRYGPIVPVELLDFGIE